MSPPLNESLGARPRDLDKYDIELVRVHEHSAFDADPRYCHGGTTAGLIRSARSRHEPTLPRRAHPAGAWPPRRPCEPTSSATQITSAAKELSGLTIV
jgi:hypothetical protein